MMKKPITILLLIYLFIFSFSASAKVTPSERIEETVNQVISVLQDNTLDKQDRRDRVKQIIRKRFDYESMSQVILGKNWRKTSQSQREQFITLFRELLEQTYYSAIDTYNNQTVRMGKERVKKTRANVQTYIIAANKEMAVSYKMRFRNDDWYAYDVTVEGVSLVSSYRTSFNNLVKEKGMDGLLTELAEKVARLKTKNKNSEQISTADDK
jgi:phospholipid transport system substrate-binding protein